MYLGHGPKYSGQNDPPCQVLFAELITSFVCYELAKRKLEKATITLHLNKMGTLDQSRASGQNGALCSSDNLFLNIEVPER